MGGCLSQQGLGEGHCGCRTHPNPLWEAARRQVRELTGQDVLENECLGHGARPAKKLWCGPG